MPESPKKPDSKWYHPTEVMKLYKLKQKKKALQARIQGNAVISSAFTSKPTAFEDVLSAKKRKNPFLVDNEANNKKPKTAACSVLDESTDSTLFNLLQPNNTSLVSNPPRTSFNNILSQVTLRNEPIPVVKAQGESWMPIDWALHKKVRLLSTKPFPWNNKLKISEESSGVTGFTRCLDSNSETNLDASPNAKFHQCCLYWQHPSLPWLTLFPRNSSKSSSAVSVAPNNAIRDSLQTAWSNSFRSLFQLIRTKQCPYFYLCANNFTVLFRAAGICGFTDVHALITPTTRGLRQMLKQDDIEFSMPFKKRNSDVGYETMESSVSGEGQGNDEEEEAPDEQWLKSMGCNAEDIKQINYRQAKLIHKAECQVDNTEESLVLVEGVEVHALYNFLINCKSATAATGPLAHIPPTLLAPVAYQGATLTPLKVREAKVQVDGDDYYSLDIFGAVLPSMIHNLFAINSLLCSVTATFTTVPSTEVLSKVTRCERKYEDMKGSAVFGKENLSDCGLNSTVLKHFCTPKVEHVGNVECLKFNSENKTYTWS